MLDEYGRADGKPARWCDPFLLRLFDPDRRLQVSDTSLIPHH